MISVSFHSRLPSIVLSAICAIGALSPLPAAAQVGPSSTEIAQYMGLHAAAKKGDAPRIETLAASKAASNARDGNGRTPLHVATFARQREAISVLVKAGADISLLDNDRYDGITIASVADDEETLGVLLALGANAKLLTSRHDGTALNAAAHMGHDGVVKQLIDAGAPLGHVNNLHWTALIESIVLGNGGTRHQECLRTPLAAGASLHLTDRQGNTPLQLAKSRAYPQMVQMLELAGAR